MVSQHPKTQAFKVHPRCPPPTYTTPNLCIRKREVDLSFSLSKQLLTTRSLPSYFTWLPTVPIAFKNFQWLSIHQSVLRQYPKLERSLPRNYHTTFRPGTIAHMPISRSAGHVLIQFLYTQTYPTLEWTGPRDGSHEAIARLKTAFEVYSVAKTFDLGGLENMAREQIVTLSEDVDSFAIVGVVSEVYPLSLERDTWFVDYMRMVSKQALTASSGLFTPPPPGESGPPVTEEEGAGAVAGPPWSARPPRQERRVFSANVLLRGFLETHLEAMWKRGPLETAVSATEETAHAGENPDEEPSSDDDGDGDNSNTLRGDSVGKTSRSTRARSPDDASPRRIIQTRSMTLPPQRSRDRFPAGREADALTTETEDRDDEVAVEGGNDIAMKL